MPAAIGPKCEQADSGLTYIDSRKILREPKTARCEGMLVMEDSCQELEANPVSITSRGDNTKALTS